MNRTTKAISALLALGFVVCFGLDHSRANEPSVTKDLPNIVLINVDDLGWMDLGCQGSKYYQTPNVDRLAKEGMRFTNAYAAASNCAPSRACMLTGQYGPRHGVFTVGSSSRGKATERKLIPIKNKTSIPKSNATIATVLKSAGYTSASIGKWHISDNPLENGFDLNVAGSHIGHPVKKLGGYHSPFSYVNCVSKKEGEYLTDRLADEAIQFVEKNSTKPFFLYLPFYTVHTPIQPKPDKKEKWNSIPGQPGQSDAGFAAMVESMDENIGRVLACLEEQGIADKTVVFFTSDNGGMWSLSRQAPLRAGKGSYFEGGIRVPLIVRWPGRIEQGRECDEPVINIDFLPTFAKIVDANMEDDQAIDGVSLMPLFDNSDATLKERSLFWHFPIYLQATSRRNQKYETHDPLFRTRPGSVIRSGKWKLHEYFEDGRLELYDLEEDVGETKNLAAQKPEIANRLHKELKEWRSRTGAKVPTQLNPEHAGQGR